MASILIFHSVLGLRAIERQTVTRFRALGHEVRAPDLFGGRTAPDVQAGFGVMDAIGWDVICRRAREAAAEAPEDTILAGFSMGAGVVSNLWPGRPRAAAILMLHGLARVPEKVSPAVRIQAHIADPDEFAPSTEVASFREAVTGAGLSPELFFYPGAGHFFTDPALADFDDHAAELVWRRVAAFLGA